MDNSQDSTESNTNKRMLDDEEKILDDLGIFGTARRSFLGQLSAAGIGLVALPHFSSDLFAQKTKNILPLEPKALLNPIEVQLQINGDTYPLQVDSRMTLLDALRERLDLTGTKKGCDHGQCGACTVIIDGERKLSCLTLSASCKDKKIKTIEGIASADKMHPMQEAFLKHDGFQCGYCTPGQICSAVALLDEAKRGEVSYVTPNVKDKVTILSDEEIRERMSGNICRCGAYNNILDAIKEVHLGESTSTKWSFATEEQLTNSKSAD